MTRASVARVVDRSLERLRVERLDRWQGSWGDYAVPGYVETAGWLAELRAAGKIKIRNTIKKRSPRIAAKIGDEIWAALDAQTGLGRSS